MERLPVEVCFMIFENLVHKDWLALTARPTLAALVRALKIVSGTAEDSSVRDAPLDMLASFSSLQHLHVVRAQLNTHVLDAIRSLPVLRSLLCTGCSFDDTPDPTNPWESELHHLTLDRPLTSQGWPTFIRPGLRSLKVSKILPTFTQSPAPVLHTADVTHLHVNPDPAASLPAFLLAFPHVRFLALLEDYVRGLSVLPPNALPLLQVFSGNAEYTPFFITGRPVHTAKLHLRVDAKSGSPPPPDVLRALRGASVPVTTLELTGVPITYAILEYLPSSLRCFAVNSEKMGVVRAWPPSLSTLHDLRTLRVTGAAGYAQETLINDVETSCRSVREVECEGARLWGRSEDGKFRVVSAWVDKVYPFYTNLLR